jgi:3-isopropylmalate dehydrogenase
MKQQSLLILAGDGIGAEVMCEVKKILNHLELKHGLAFEIAQDLVGGVSIDAHQCPVTDAVIEKAKAADAVLLGAVGGPKWDHVPYAIRPEAGLLRLRKELDLFANLRPAIVFDALADASTLKKDVIQGLDILIIRELTGGVYFGEPRGIEDLGNGQRRGFNTQTYTTHEIQRVGRVAFDLARKRSGRVCSMEKGNVMESGRLWREEMTALHKADYADVELSHMYADNGAMQLLRNPRQFDVIVTDNLFGDILSDQAAMLTGSLGMLPSASLGAKDIETGRAYAMYEPVHGSAPDIAGQNKANPLATILSLAMALRYSLNAPVQAQLIEDAVKSVLDQNLRTGDIMGEGSTLLSTTQMGDAVVQAMVS